MYYDRFSEKNELILLGHMCNIKVEINKFSDFFQFLQAHKIKTSLVCTLEGRYYYISLFSSTKKHSEELFNTLLNWNP